MEQQSPGPCDRGQKDNHSLSRTALLRGDTGMRSGKVGEIRGFKEAWSSNRACQHLTVDAGHQGLGGLDFHVLSMSSLPPLTRLRSCL